MFFELIAAIVAGLAAAGGVLLLNRISGGRLPRWSMPAAAGAAIIGFTIFMEYNWFDRTTSDFPEGVEVTFTHEARAPWRPWTYLWPLVDRFSAVDLASIRTNDAVPEQRMVNLLLFARWSGPKVVPVIYDCAERRMAPLLDTVDYDESGAVAEADWGPVPDDDPTFSIVCKEA
ncbi:hypothetical protein [Tropicimonas sediminicola]|uniref:Uncharacterized protein n=1 Tax=Tropicimonas sediminicola TaxID=1031541 RepID=A0A239FNP7_9RHOB|nr:hypothetical protein [Tropicimonas sediminicola]SNS58500.1 hypothetical protein SAMN05421757_102767 [Tropicimonas sediminicola]